MPKAKILDLNDFSEQKKQQASIICSSLSFQRGDKKILSDISITFPKTGISVIMGPNGAGKSVLLRTIIGLLKPDSGHVILNPEFAGKTALVFQRPVLIRRTVYGNLHHALGIAGFPRRQRRSRIEELIAIGGLTGLENLPARSLSGGEQQRLQMVRALSSNPKLILLDEPSASLDPQSTHAIEEIIKSTSDKNVKLVLVTHDIGQAKRLADDVTFIHKGKILEQNSSPGYFNSPSTPEVKSYLEGDLLV